MRYAQSVSTAPNVEREARARATLKEIDDCLDIRWIWRAVHVDDVNGIVVHWEGRYAIVSIYKEHDPALAWYRQTGAPDPYVKLGWYTEDMSRAESRPIPCDEMEPKVRTFLAQMDGENTDHGSRLAALQISEFEREARLKDDVLDESVWEALEHRREFCGIPYVGAYTTRRG